MSQNASAVRGSHSSRHGVVYAARRLSAQSLRRQSSMHLDHAHLGHAAAEAPAPHDDHDHFVQFYEHEDALLALVGEYLGEGLQKGDLLLVIATPEHQDGFCEQLARSGLPVDRAIAEGRFKLLDARETLSKFMVNGLPDWERFRL